MTINNMYSSGYLPRPGGWPFLPVASVVRSERPQGRSCGLCHVRGPHTPARLARQGGRASALDRHPVAQRLGGEPVSRKSAIAIIINALWLIDSIALLFTGCVEPTVLGYTFIIGQALVAELQFTGLRRAA